MTIHKIQCSQFGRSTVFIQQMHSQMLHAMLPLNLAKVSMLDLWKPISAMNFKKVIVTFYLAIQINLKKSNI